VGIQSTGNSSLATRIQLCSREQDAEHPKKSRASLRDDWRALVIEPTVRQLLVSGSRLPQTNGEFILGFRGWFRLNHGHDEVTGASTPIFDLILTA